jgi:hypothetical protein
VDIATIITKATVWLALLCYTGAILSRGLHNQTLMRTMWLAGCVFFLAHVAAAFHFFYHWSHAFAVEDTRAQTMALTGVNFRGGLFFNYLFALIWLIDCAGFLHGGKLFQETHVVWRRVLHTFFIFMIFNATVVFGHGWAKPAGGVVCVVALFALRKWKQSGAP